MGKKGTLVEFANLRKAVYKYIEDKKEFYLSDKMVEDIFKKYQGEVLSRPMLQTMKAGQHSKFKAITNRGPLYLRIQIAKIINYTKDFYVQKSRDGGVPHYERILIN
jgi:hypothetical protein|tara:strand:+ start:549 stop:869 length:321 start_codon:yes stop_codon:yes gene_type:complete